jgi:hypothetical protein
MRSALLSSHVEYAFACGRPFVQWALAPELAAFFCMRGYERHGLQHVNQTTTGNALPCHALCSWLPENPIVHNRTRKNTALNGLHHGQASMLLLQHCCNICTAGAPIGKRLVCTCHPSCTMLYHSSSWSLYNQPAGVGVPHSAPRPTPLPRRTAAIGSAMPVACAGPDINVAPDSTCNVRRCSLGC